VPRLDVVVRPIARAPSMRLLIAVVVAVLAGCGGSAPSVGLPSPDTVPSTGTTAMPASTDAQPSLSASPATYSDYDAAVCAAFTSLVRAYGNPDTDSPSVMRTALEDAVAANDPAAAERAAAAMLDELETGRRFAATAALWEPGASAAGSLDRLLLAFEAWTSAKLAGLTDPSAIDPQTAFEQAGGPEAWSGTLQGLMTVEVPPGASPGPCPAFSGEV
jgi:hypothetical protein